MSYDANTCHDDLFVITTIDIVIGAGSLVMLEWINEWYHKQSCLG